MRRALLALSATAVLAAPAGADYYQFTGTLTISPGSMRFLPIGKSVAGSGVGFSGVAPSNEIHLPVVNGFTGTLQTAFGSTAGFTQQAFVTQVGAGDFTKPKAGGLHGKMAVGGIAQRRFVGQKQAAFPLSASVVTGLGLGGTLPAISGKTPAVKFASWTTRTVSVPSVILASHPAMGSYSVGTISAKGYDARTTMGMGAVQLVTPIRTISGVPANRGAFARLTLQFAPEPARGALLLAGGALVALLGARARRA